MSLMKTFESLNESDQELVRAMANAARNVMRDGGTVPRGDDAAARFDEACAVFFKSCKELQAWRSTFDRPTWPKGDGKVALDYAGACAEIRAGRAHGDSLWLILSKAEERDGFGLKPEVWEGPGQYQSLTHDDGRQVLVYLPTLTHLPEATK